MVRIDVKSVKWPMYAAEFLKSGLGSGAPKRRKEGIFGWGVVHVGFSRAGFSIQDVYLGVPLGLTPREEREGGRMGRGGGCAVTQSQAQPQPTHKELRSK